MKTLFKARVNKDLFKYLLNQHKALISVYTVLFFALFPLSVITQILRPAFSTIMINPNPTLVPYVLVALAVPVFVISPFILFNYAFSKRAVNTFHAMPIKRRDLFSTLTLVSIISVVIPFMFNYLLGYGIAYLGSNVKFDIEHIYNLIRCVVLLVAISSIAILVITNTGALSEGIIYTCIAIMIPFVGIMAFSFFADRFILGYTDISELFLYYLTPLVSLFRIFSNDVYSNFNFQADLVSSYWFIATLLMSVISINIFDNRKSERSEQPFTNNLFFPIVASCFTVFFMLALISMFAPYNETLFQPTSFIMPVMISFIMFIILNIIKNRSTKGLSFAVKNFIIIVVITMVISVTIVLTGGFGYVNRVPESEKVGRVVIDNSYTGFQLPGSSYEYVIEDPEAIQLFVDFHKSIINESSDDYEITDTYRYSTLKFSYELTNGSSLRRTYSVDETKLKDFLDMITHSVSAKTNLDSLRNSKFIKEFVILSPLLNTQYTFNGDLSTLLDTYYNEMNESSILDFNSNGGKLVYNILISLKNHYQVSTLHIDERFVNTIAYIEANLSDNTIDTTIMSNLQLIEEDGDSGCYFSPFHGVISTDANYYGCSNTSYKAQDTTETNYDVYPYSNSDKRFEVIQATFYEDGMTISLLLPVVKK